MSMTGRMVLVALVCWLCSGLLLAQDTANPYDDVPMSRTADGAFVMGEPDAGVKLIEFADFLCTSCQNYKPIISSFVWDYVITGRAQIEYRIFPVVDANLSVLSASLVECADTLRPGSFWWAHDVMFGIVSSNGFTPATGVEFAAALGLEAADLEACAADASQYMVDSAYGASLGVTGTPSLFLQYGDREPVEIALALAEHYPAIVNAIRPEDSEPVVIAHGRYTGISTFRRGDGGLVLGEPGAALTIVAFEDFLCPHCQTYQETLHLFIEQYVRSGQAQFEFRFYPLVNPQYSTHTAQIAECVAAQDLGLFWDAHDLLFEFASAGNLGDMAANVANLLDLDADVLAECSGRAVQFLVDTQLGQSTGVSGTPAMRARANNGELDVIFAGGQAMDRGGAPLEVLSALVERTGDVTIGAPELSLLNEDFLEDSGLVTGDPCSAPCWQTITPGETSLANALEAVAGLDGIEIMESNEESFLFGNAGAEPCCQIASQDGQTVATILLQYSPKIGIGEVIAVHGEPPFVSGQPVSEGEAVLSFFYPEQRMLVYAVVPGIEGKLEETTPIISVVFSTEAILSQVFENTPFDNWKGYLRYSDYMDGEFDFTP